MGVEKRVRVNMGVKNGALRSAIEENNILSGLTGASVSPGYHGGYHV